MSVVVRCFTCHEQSTYDAEQATYRCPLCGANTTMSVTFSHFIGRKDLAANIPIQYAGEFGGKHG